MENITDHQTSVSIGNLQEVLKDLFEITHAKGNNIDPRTLYLNLIEEEYKELVAEKPSTPNDFGLVSSTLMPVVMTLKQV